MTCFFDHMPHFLDTAFLTRFSLAREYRYDVRGCVHEVVPLMATSFIIVIAASPIQVAACV
jgi:hypothetical protein